MGDDVVIKAIAVIHGGLLQIDLWNNSTNQGAGRLFIEPHGFFAMLGKSMQASYEAWIESEVRAETEPQPEKGGGS